MPNTAPPTTQAPIMDLETAYTVAGEGPAVMMLHGWGAHRGLVWPLGEKLSEQGFRVIIPDLPGFGDTPPPPTTWTVHDYANFVLAFMDALDVPKAHLFGHSFGGRLSIVLSANHAERFEKVVLCDAAGVKPKTPWHRQLPVTLYRSVEGLVGDVGMVQKLRDRYRNRIGSTDYLNAGPLKETFLAVIEEDLLPYTPMMTHPTLLVWGDKDEDTPLWQAKALEDAIPDAGLVVFKGAGHYSYLDALPDAVRVIDYFFTHDA
jgi:pimeloyl-ACP methyl ester carboxylesterase